MSRWALVLSFCALPGLFAWWSGGRIVRRLDDPALPERLLQRNAHLQLLLIASVAAAVVSRARYSWIALALGLLAVWVGDLPSRRVLFEERWSLGTYLGWQVRLTLAWFGFWMLLAIAPVVVYGLGTTLGLPVAVLLASVLIAWNHRFRDVFLRVLRATTIPARASWEPVLQRTRVPRPGLYELPVPGGRFVNAVALPATDTPVVVLSQSLLESFDDAEQAAVLAHELAHLEVYDPPRLWRLALAIDAIAVASTLGVTLVVRSFPDTVSGLLVGLVWFGALLGGAMWWVAAQKAHETESDARAVALCGDAEALVRALTKLTVLNALPRRWSVEFEAACSHPSLARRVLHVRRVAGIGNPRLDAPVVVAARAPGTFLLFEPGRLVWLDGVPADCPRAPDDLSRRARRARVLSYAELADLRVDAGTFRSARLVAVDTSAHRWSVAVPPAALPGLQAALDRIDGLLAHDELPAAPRGVPRVLALLLLGVAPLGQALGGGILAAAIGVLRPGRAALAGIAAVGLSCVILTVDRSTRVALASRDLVGTVVAALVLAGAAWLVARGRRRAEPRMDIAVPIGLYAVAAALVWAPLAWELSHEPAALPLGVAIHRTPVAWITALALAASLLAARRRAVRLVGAAGSLAVVAVVVGVSIADLRSMGLPAAVPGEGPRDARLVAAIDLPGGSGRLRSSPGGRRVAVALPNQDGRWLVAPAGAADAERRVIRGRDLHFVDEDRVLVLAGHAEHAVRLIDVRTGETLRAPIPIGPLADPYFQSVRDGAWAVFGADASRSFEAAFGTLASDVVRYGRWEPARTARAWAFRVWALSPREAVQLVSVPTALSRMPWGRLLYWQSGQPTESRIWRLEGDDARHLVTWAGGVRCLMPSRAVAPVCAGWRGWEGGVVVWRLGTTSGPGRPPLSVPGSITRWGISDDGQIFAMHSGDVVTIVDLERPSLARWRLERSPASIIQLLPMPDRLALLGSAGDRTVLSFYRTSHP